VSSSRSISSPTLIFAFRILSSGFRLATKECPAAFVALAIMA
jgi:hypothetical protein